MRETGGVETDRAGVLTRIKRFGLQGRSVLCLSCCSLPMGRSVHLRVESIEGDDERFVPRKCLHRSCSLQRTVAFGIGVSAVR